MNLINCRQTELINYKQNEREAKTINTLCEVIAEKIANELLKNQENLLQEISQKDTTKKIAIYSKKLEEEYQIITFEPKKSETMIDNSFNNLESYIHTFFIQKVLKFSICQKNDLLKENQCKCLSAVSIVLNEAILQNAYDCNLPTTPRDCSEQHQKNTQLKTIQQDQIQWKECSTIHYHTKMVLENFYSEKGYTPEILYRIIKGCYPKPETKTKKGCIVF